MITIHQTKEGKIILIASMDNDHLSNTIQLHCRRIKEIISIIDTASMNIEMTASQKVLTGVDKLSKVFNKKALAANLEERIDKLMPYILEANIRGLNITPVLQDTFGRKDMFPTLLEAHVDNNGNINWDDLI